MFRARIAVTGGRNVGKTAIINRLISEITQSEEQVVDEYSSDAVAQFEILSTFNEKICDFELIEMSDEVLTRGQTEKLLSTLDAIIIVVDCSSSTSMKSADSWTVALEDHASQIPRYLIVNKADTVRRIISTEAVERFANATGFADWMYTVGFWDLGDVDMARGDYVKQGTPAEVLQKVLRNVFHNVGLGPNEYVSICSPLSEHITFAGLKDGQTEGKIL
jgi:GTPase SAR1 family protein